MHRKRITPRACRACGTAFFARIDHVEAGGGIYCSRKCRSDDSRGQVRGPRPAPAPIILPDATALIPLCTRSRATRGHAVVDAVDAEWAGRWRWCRDKDGYAVREERGERRVRILMHRALLHLAPEDHVEVDHINRDRLDNRRGNLRAVPKAGNRQNVPGVVTGSSAYRGVTWNRRQGTWQAQVRANGRNHNLGQFATEEEAAEAARAGRRALLPYAVD